MTLRTSIALALSALLFHIMDAWKLIPEHEAVQQIDGFIGIDYTLTKEWYYTFVTYNVVPWILSLILVIDAKGKEPMKRAMYWILLGFFSFELIRFFYNFKKDNFFYYYLFIPSLFFLLSALFRHHAKYDLIFQVKEMFRKLRSDQKVKECDARKA